MSVSVRQFVGDLVAFGLMSADDVRAFFKASGISTSTSSGCETLAEALRDAGKITAFQAACLTEGHADRLVYGRYLVLEKIGSGGMGDVFRAVHRQMDRIVALKVISAQGANSLDNLDRFRREVKMAARLHHPNIVTAYDADEHRGNQFLVMEYVEGEALSDLVRRQGPFSVEKTLDIAVQTATGLEYAHREGLVHRDIKPGNLLIDRRGVVKILDLGLARGVRDMDLSKAAVEAGLTHSGQVVGTCHYMAPEQATDARQADRRADIYSLGCTLHFLLTGKAPYLADSVFGTLIAHRERPIPSLLAVRPETPPLLEQTFRKMLAKHPEARQVDMSQVLRELEGCREVMARRADPAPIPVAVPLASVATAGSVSEASKAPPLASETHRSVPTLPQARSRSRSPRRAARRGKRAFPWGRVLAFTSAVAIACLAAAFLWFNQSKKEDTSTTPPPDPNPAPASRAGEGNDDNTFTPPELAGKPWIYLLPLIDPPKDAVQGDWRLENDFLHVAAGKHNRLEVPFVPVGSYQVRAVFRRSGAGEINVILPIAERYTRLWLTGPDNAIVGGLDAAPLAGAKAPDPVKPTALDPKVAHELRINVELVADKVSIYAALDGQALLRWKGAATRLQLDDAWDLGDSDRLGIGAEVVTVFEALEIRLLDGPASAPATSTGS